MFSVVSWFRSVTNSNVLPSIVGGFSFCLMASVTTPETMLVSVTIGGQKCSTGTEKYSASFSAVFIEIPSRFPDFNSYITEFGMWASLHIFEIVTPLLSHKPLILLYNCDKLNTTHLCSSHKLSQNREKLHKPY